MTFATDRDLLAFEPNVFRDVAWTAQKRASDVDGMLSGTTLSSVSSDFVQARIDAGHVVLVSNVAIEVISRDSATGLTVSLVRDSINESPIAPPLGAGPHVFSVHTFGPQIGIVHAQVMRSIGLEVGDEARVVNPDALLPIEALGALHLVFGAGAALVGANDAMLAKAEFYRDRVAAERGRAAVRIDLDGDGEADVVRRLNTVQFVRV